MIRKLAGQTAIYGLSTIIPRLINYLLTPYLTYIALNEYEYGVMGYFYATIPFGLAILTMGMENGFFKFMGKSTDIGQRQQVFNTTFSFVTILSIIAFGLVYLLQNDIYNLIGLDFAKSVIPITGGIMALDAMSAIPFAKLREEERGLKFVYLKAVSVIINVALVLFFYSALPQLKDSALFGWMWIEGYGSGYVFVANIVSSFIVFVMLLFVYKNIRFRLSAQMLKAILAFSIPLFISGLCATTNEFIDRQMLLNLLPRTSAAIEIGIYSATLKITSLMVIFTQMYRFAAEPLFLSKLHNEEFRKGNADATKFFIIASLTIFLGITLFLSVFEKFVGANFRQGIGLIPILLIANILLGIHLNLSFWYKYIEKTYFAIIITVIGLVVNIGINYFFIPEYGYTASAWAKFFSVGTMVLVSYLLNQYYYPIPYDLKRIGEYSLLAVGLYYAGEILRPEHQWTGYIINLLLLLLFIVWTAYREKIMQKLKTK